VLLPGTPLSLTGSTTQSVITGKEDSSFGLDVGTMGATPVSGGVYFKQQSTSTSGTTTISGDN
jgi:hypothetical protein